MFREDRGKNIIKNNNYISYNNKIRIKKVNRCKDNALYVAM